MSHGNITVKVGTCPVCEREGVELHRYTDAEGTERLSCTDEFACFAAFRALNTPGTGSPPIPAPLKPGEEPREGIDY